MADEIIVQLTSRIVQHGADREKLTQPNKLRVGATAFSEMSGGMIGPIALQ